MSTTNIILLVIAGVAAFVLLVGGITWVMLRRRKQRTEALRQASMRLGFDFREEPDKALLDDLEKKFELFRKGSRRGEFRNYLEGEIDGFGAAVFDYSYHVEMSGPTGTGTATSDTEVKHSAALIRLKKALPAFTLRCENISDKLKDVVGMHDIDLEHDPEFSKHFFLQGEDVEAVKAFFGPELTQAFGDRKSMRNIFIESAGGQLLFYQRKYVAPENIQQFMDRAGQTARLFESRV